jgi:hypothetical protein
MLAEYRSKHSIGELNAAQCIALLSARLSTITHAVMRTPQPELKQALSFAGIHAKHIGIIKPHY